jgi:glucose-6-phosphate isomerase
MALHTINPTTTSAWKKLELHYHEMQNASMQEMFLLDANNRTDKFNLKWNDFTGLFKKHNQSRNDSAIVGIG